MNNFMNKSERMAEVIGPMVTVIIPTYNAGKNFAHVLEGLKNQTVKSHQILVFDSQSDDDTVELAEKYNCLVTVIKKSDFGHGKTRNLAVSQSCTEIFVLLTQDAVADDENMIYELIKPILLVPMIAICYGRQLPKADAKPLAFLARELNYPAHSVLKNKDKIDKTGLKTFFCSNSCSAFRRSTFEKLGRFKNDVMVNEDMLLGAKAIREGYSIYYNAQAKVRHSHNYSLPQTFSRYFNIGRFFADNRPFFKQVKLGHYGGGMLKAGIKKLMEKGMPHYIIALLAESTVKAVACKLGWYYHLLLGRKC
jgi:rhamnosyltransferase